MISAARSSPLLRAGVIGLYVLAVEWTRALLAHDSRFIAAGLLLGGVALGLAALGWPATRLGLGRSRFAVRVIGGLALGAVAAAGLLLGLWRWACKDLVAPIIGHVIADLAL